jgi:Protein of unknown function (DUF1572)
MTEPTAGVGQAFLAEARRCLARSHERIGHCLDQLDDAQLCWRPRESMNSVANILLHLCSNLRQWIVSGLTGAPDVRDRPQEFAKRGPIPKAELVRRLTETVHDADAALAGVGEAQLLEPRCIQGYDETVLSAVFESLTHLSGHTQEVVHLTRLQLGEHYRFAWAPSTPEQGGPLPSEAVVAATDAVFEKCPAGLPDPAAPAPPSSGGEDCPEGQEPPPGSPLGDFVREIQQEFMKEEDEGKL